MDGWFKALVSVTCVAVLLAVAWWGWSEWRGSEWRAEMQTNEAAARDARASQILDDMAQAEAGATEK